jgi:DNA-directed RNA polymerase specialized sigma24 family protein
MDPTDVLQETFLHAIRDVAQFRGSSGEELVGWLRQILGARFVDLVRSYSGYAGRGSLVN